MFQKRQWPEGFEFPACKICNQSSDNQDLIIAMLARFDPTGRQSDDDGKLAGLMKAVNLQFPSLFNQMMPSAVEARQRNRELGITPPHGGTHQEAGAVKIPAQIHEAVCVFARKLGKAIFYKESGNIFPDAGCILLNWFTNADFLRDGKYATFESLQELGGNVPTLKRSSQFLNSQFQYKLSISDKKDVFVLQALFGKAFGLVLFGSSQTGLLEASVLRLRKQTGRPGPFTVLQSPTLT
jgi:hypothetical protein